jgi:hypothetical protein
MTVAVVGLLTVSAFAFGSSSGVAKAADPDTLVDSFSGENSITSGSSTWQWITGTDDESFPNTTTRSVVTGTVILGSSTGAAVSGRLGVCYEAASGGLIADTNWEIVDFTAPAGQWVTQTISGTIDPATAENFDVGLCAYDTSANLTYNTGFGAAAGTVIVAINSGS